MRSKLININELPIEKNQIVINAKPNLLLIFLIAFSLLLFNFGQLIYVGLGIGITCIYALIFLPKRTLMIFRENYMIIYNTVERDNCHMLYYDEIITWQYEKHRDNDLLIIELTNGKVYKSEIFNQRKTCMLMHSYIERGK